MHTIYESNKPGNPSEPNPPKDQTKPFRGDSGLMWFFTKKIFGTTDHVRYRAESAIDGFWFRGV